MVVPLRARHDVQYFADVNVTLQEGFELCVIPKKQRKTWVL